MAISLKEKGYDVDIISLKWKNNLKFNIYNELKIYKILGRRFTERKPFQYLIRYILFFIQASIKVTQLNIKNKYDLIHVHNIPDFLVFTTLIPKLFGTKIILDIHDIQPEFAIQKFSIKYDHPIIKTLELVEKVSCCYADHVITVTELWKQD